ncbi:MAG TPA: protein translocase subunit SecD [Thermoanaerobaculia bacterium]|nr:protein translocase subunit SecD [Thermoanaerobaculia bacterium]
MNRSLLWRGLLILAVVAVAAYSAYPPQESVKLGLDLRGGIHLVLGVQTEDALRAEANKDMDRLVQELEDRRLSGLTTALADPNTFVLRGLPRDQGSALGKTVDEFLPGWGYDWEGAEVRFRRDASQVQEIEDQAVRQAQQTIDNRINAYGVAEPVIQRQGLGSNRIVVQLPGVDDPERIKGLIKNTAFLEFRLTDYPPNGGAAFDRNEILAHYGGSLPDDVEIFSQDQRDPSGVVTGQVYYALQNRQVITGRDLKDARPGLGQFNEPVVSFSLTPEGARIFGEVTGANIGRGLAIVLDGKVQSAPTIEGRISDSGIIRGNFTQTEVEDLSMVLRSGALPAGIEYLEERTVGPSLGQDSIDRGLRAGLVGLVLVVLAMLVVYKGTGINAVVALTLNCVLVFGALAYFGATLTLPGIAGIVLTLGMAVDANVLVFERIREELHNGRTVKSAVEAGFSKALSSVLDSQITTLIAALFLFNFGTGPIRGFAVTLSIGILASLFTALICSRLIFDLVLSRPGRIERLSI